jgi:hypothetical protein
MLPRRTAVRRFRGRINASLVVYRSALRRKTIAAYETRLLLQAFRARSPHGGRFLAVA